MGFVTYYRMKRYIRNSLFFNIEEEIGNTNQNNCETHIPLFLKKRYVRFLI